MSNPKIIKLKTFIKKSGNLLPIEFNKKFPITVKRIFFIFGKKDKMRGDHAHKKCSQLFIPISGKIVLIIKRKNKKIEIILNSKNSKAVLVPPLEWCKLKFLTTNAIIMVACDRKYEFSDYIEKYNDFLKIKKNI